MNYSEILYCIAAFLNMIGFIGALLPGIPGPPVSYIGLLLCCIAFPSPLMIVITVIIGIDTMLVSIIDYVAPGILANHAGGCKKAVWGANIGLLIGLFFSPWGLIVGPFIGAFVGEMINSKRNLALSIKVSTYTFLSIVMGAFMKLLLCFIILCICVVNFIVYVYSA